MKWGATGSPGSEKVWSGDEQVRVSPGYPQLPAGQGVPAHSVARCSTPLWKWGASVARCSPYRWNPLLLPGAARTALLSDVTQSVRTSLRGNCERLVVVGTCGCERFYGAFRPGKNTVFQYTSILVRPHQNWPRRAVCGGAAGYCPRVRCIYFTAQFITIAGRSRQLLYRRRAINVKGRPLSPSSARPGSRGAGPLPRDPAPARPPPAASSSCSRCARSGR